jgi:surface antigen
MFYHLAGQASAAEAPTTVGEIVNPPSPIELVKHDPVNFDKADVKETRPNIDSSIKPEAPQTSEISSKNKLVSVVDGTVASAEEPVHPTVTRQAASNTGNVVNHFTYGYCTWYVANRRVVPWTGNAGVWYSQAISYGFKVGNVPAVGAIMVTRESALGHVAYVEAVNSDGSWSVSEMNYVRWSVISSRTIKPGTLPIIGFIY